MAFLQAIAKEDILVAVANQDFIGATSLRERFSQQITYRSIFGYVNPVIRTKSPSDSNTVSFSFILLKSGVEKGLNSYRVLRSLQDFQIGTVKGKLEETYNNANWTDIDIDTGLDACTVSVDCSVPGFVP